MRASDVPVHLEAGGMQQKCAGRGDVLPSALNHVWRGLPSLALQGHAACRAALWRLLPLCFGFLGFLCVKVAICANSLLCLCHPCRPQPLLGLFVCTFCAA